MLLRIISKTFLSRNRDVWRVVRQCFIFIFLKTTQICDITVIQEFCFPSTSKEDEFILSWPLVFRLYSLVLNKMFCYFSLNRGIENLFYFIFQKMHLNCFCGLKRILLGKIEYVLASSIQYNDG